MHALTRLFGAPTLVLALLAWSALPHVASAQNAAADQSGPDVRAAVESAKSRVFPSVVNITVRTVTYWGGKENKGGSIGSGTIISPDGLVLTNHHVVEDGRTYRVTLADKREADATLVGKDPLTDLALLRIDRASLKDDAPLPYATFGDSDSVKVGEYVMAMGAPFGLSRTVTLGIVSNTERVFTSSTGDDLADQEFDAETSSDIFTRWLQHDALINPGNSGGPLVNLSGEIVGVNTRGGTGMGFAVPANLARAVAGQLAEKGEVVRSTIGVALKSVKRSGHADGVLVNSVQADGPAGKAGIKPGDVLIEMDGAPLSARFPEDIPLIARTIADRPVGSQVQFKVLRAGETISATLTTEKLLREKGDEAAFRMWGFSAREITERLARNRKLDDRKGAIIFGVRPGGPAAIAEPALQAAT